MCAHCKVILKNQPAKRLRDGGLHALSPICTHMKCNVQWNLAEQSWDCPCHGARYSPDGKLLTGPATGDLELIELQTLVEKNT